jgi:creatinine amidohydrolase
MIDVERLRLRDPKRARELVGDGNFGGRYERPDHEMLALWQVAVEETRALIEGPWA